MLYKSHAVHKLYEFSRPVSLNIPKQTDVHIKYVFVLARGGYAKH